MSPISGINSRSAQDYYQYWQLTGNSPASLAQNQQNAVPNAVSNNSAPGALGAIGPASTATISPAVQQDSLRINQAKQQEKLEKQTGIKECKTCQRRKYQDQSNDPGVSMKFGATLNPSQAAVAVSSHEQEHVIRERDKATRENREVVSQNVQIHTGVCPECGRTYVSGGTTETTTRTKAKPEVREDFLGHNIDIKV